jgi:hypothetical protein
MKKKFSRILGVGLALTLLTSLLVVAAPALADVTQPTVTIDATENAISYEDAGYAVRFVLGVALVQDDTITITLPSDTTTDNTSLSATIGAGVGWFGDKQLSANLTSVAVTGNNDARSITYTLNGADDGIGEGAEVRLKINAGITNPTAAGTYTLTVATSKETNPVTSASYSIVEPTIPPLPGIVSLYNPSGVLMNQKTGDTAIQDMINAATAGFTVEIGPGSYDEDPNTVAAMVTIRGSGSASEVIVKGDWTVDVDDITVDNIKIQGKVTVTSDDVVIQNCLISHTSAIAPAATTFIATSGAADDVTVQGCTIDATAGTVADTGVDVGAGDVLVTGCTINVDAGDTAIKVSGAAESDATNNTITGASGVGYSTTVASTDLVSENTFEGLLTAVKATGTANMTVSGNLMQNGTVTVGSTFLNAEAAVDVVSVAASGKVIISGNDIQNNAGYSVTVRADAGLVNVVGNYMSGNTYGLQNKDTTLTVLKAMLNYWGASTGPTHVTNLAGTGDTVSDYVSFKPFATTTVPEVSTATLAAAGTIDRSTTVGISFTSTAACQEVTLARYSANPAMSSPRYAALANGYYDVYAPTAAGDITILFYNAGIDADSVAYYYSTLSQSWTRCSTQAVAGNNAYVIVTVKTTTSPAVNELGGTPFVLVTVPPSPSVTISSPELGAYDIPITPMFTWETVVGAVRYELTLSEDPTFAIIEWSYNVDTNFYKATDDLRYSTTYYWRVRALTGEPYQVGPAWVTPSGPWSTGIFTTMDEPLPPAEELPTEITVETPEVTVTPGEVTVDVAPAVPDYLLWTIVGIGAVLIIALIVLIVRTRRVA